jgi:hypothetical protein
VTVKRGTGGSGIIDIGAINITGGLKSLNARGARLVGSGVDCTGAVGGITIGALSNTRIKAATLGTVVATEISNSLIAAGFVPFDAADPIAGGTFAAGAQVKVLKTKQFAGSTVAANVIGKAQLGTVNTNNSGRAFGVFAHDAIGGVRVSSPRGLTWDPAGANDQALGDFHIKH